MPRDDSEEKQREEKDAKTALDKRLNETGNVVRQREKSRKEKRASDSDGIDTGEIGGRSCLLTPTMSSWSC